MVARNRGPSDPNIASLIQKLRKVSYDNEVGIWRSVSKKLQKPRRNRSEVNISKINRYTNENDTILVPGKVLGSGDLEHAVTVAALSFSMKAKQKIETANGKVISIEELISENPKGSKIRILG